MKGKEKEREGGDSLETPCNVRNEANRPLVRASLPGRQLLRKQRVAAVLHSQSRDRNLQASTPDRAVFVYIVTIE